MDAELLTLAVNANDIFAWAASESVEIRNEEALESLCHMMHEPYGVIRWCCIQANTKPQKPIVDDMKSVGAWDDVMEGLQDNWLDGTDKNV